MMLNEEEFYDAVETALDKHDEEEEENDDVVKIAKFTFSTRRNAQINMNQWTICKINHQNKSITTAR